MFSEVSYSECWDTDSDAVLVSGDNGQSHRHIAVETSCVVSIVEYHSPLWVHV